MSTNNVTSWSELPDMVRLECVMKWTKQDREEKKAHHGTETDDAVIRSGRLFAFSFKADAGTYHASLNREGSVFRGHFTFSGDTAAGGGPGNAECTIYADREPYMLSGRWTQASGVFDWSGELHPI